SMLFTTGFDPSRPTSEVTALELSRAIQRPRPPARRRVGSVTLVDGPARCRNVDTGALRGRRPAVRGTDTIGRPPHAGVGTALAQLLTWFGADDLKVERPGVGDVTRNQRRDIADLDALYFTMLNSNKRSLEVNTKAPEGKAILEKLIREADVLVENFAPGAMD